MDDHQEPITKTLGYFSDAVDKIAHATFPLLTTLQTLRSLSTDDLKKFDGLSRARLHVTMAYTVNSLFIMYLRAQGIDPSSHPVSSELARLQDAFLRLRKVEAGRSSKHEPAPKRDVRENITKMKIAQNHLACLIFPDEKQLIHALTASNQREKYNEESDDCPGQAKTGPPSDKAASIILNVEVVEKNAMVKKEKKKKKKKNKSIAAEPTKPSTLEEGLKRKPGVDNDNLDEDGDTKQNKRKKRKKSSAK